MRKQGNIIATIPQHIFAENTTPPSIVTKLPEIDERLANTPQLACCLSLLKTSNSLDTLEPAARTWIQAIEKDDDEKERLKVLSLDVIRAYKRDELKDARVVAEVVYLAPVLEKDVFRDLLRDFYHGVDRSGLLDFHQLDGLAQLIQGADTGYLDADDLVKILGLLSTRLQDAHQQSQKHIHQLTLTASHVLDAMADTKVSGLDREKLHEPLLSYLNSLKESSDPYLVYQAAYAYQALLYVPDDETLWQAAFRRTNKVIQGMAGLVKAVKGLDLNGFIDGLKDIQQGLAGVSEVAQGVKSTYDGVISFAKSCQGFTADLKEGFSFKRKCAWYPALRGADALIQNGEFATFKKLVCQAPCRLDPAFQWGVCQRLGEIAANPMWDTTTRHGAVGFLGELYQNDREWGQDVGIKEWILVILMRLSSPSESALQCKCDCTAVRSHEETWKDRSLWTVIMRVGLLRLSDLFNGIVADTLLQELEASANPQQRTLIQTSREKNTTFYPLKVAVPSLASSSLLDRVQNKPNVEGTLRQLREQRLKEQGHAVYIQPQAKASLQASDDQRFALMEKVEEFLEGNQKVFLLLGDSGAGKSTFNRQLECELWHKYKKNFGRIPLHINLPAIEKPEQDMIAKQLRKAEFTEPEIRELKVHRKFILICDGYDESHQTHNLYMSNRLNQPGEWDAQMAISCRSEYIGIDYRDRFQPGDRNTRQEQRQFQEAVITPFTLDQVKDYIEQYVSIHQPLWEAKDYEQALDLIPGLKELVRNPFLMTLSLEVLPRMVDPGEHLSATKVTRVGLYDQFIEHWLERGKKRLSEKELSPQTKAAFESLIDEGFAQNGIDFLKKLSVAIYKEQDGHPIVRYSRFKDEGSWKKEFFNREDEKQLLREACPLTRNGNQYRFIHRSLLEYGLALAVFDPNDWKEEPLPGTYSGRRGSAGSAYSFRILRSMKETTPVEQGPDLNSPLAWRYFVDEPSVLQFLTERVQQEPVFKQQLLDCIEHSKTDKKWRTAAANSITILVRAGVQFNRENLRGIQIPGADLSYGVFDSAQLQDADLRQVSLRGAWLRRADLSRAQMGGVQFGEVPYVLLDESVYSCAYSPDGRSFAVSLDNGLIEIYSTSSMDYIRGLKGHGREVMSIAYSPEGDQIISGSYDGTAKLWDVEAETCTYTLNHPKAVHSVAFSPLGDTVASAGSNGARIWEVKTGECRITLAGPDKKISSVVYSPNGDLLTSDEDGDNAVRLWDVKTGICLHILTGHSDLTSGIACSPLGGRIAASHVDATIRIWDVETGVCCRVLNCDKLVRSVAFSSQGDLIASAGDDNTARIWDVETGACRQVFRGHWASVKCIAISPKGDTIVTIGGNSMVRLWDVAPGGTRQSDRGHDKTVWKAVFSPNGDQVASCSEEGTIGLWDAESGFCRLLSDITSIPAIAYSPRGDLLASIGDYNFLRLWDAETGTCQQLSTSHLKNIRKVAFSPQGDQVISGHTDGSVRIWDVETGECRFTFTNHTGRVTSIVSSPKCNQVASGSEDSTIRLWDVESGVCVHTLSGHDYSVTSIVYSSRGDLLVSASEDLTVRVWDVETGDCRRICIGYTEVWDVACSPQGDRVASGYWDEWVKIWDLGTGECLHTLTGHTNNVRRAAFSPKGDRIVTISGETARLWDVASGQCQAETEIEDSIKCVAWSTMPNANCFVTGCDSGSVCMWKVIEEGDKCRLRWHWRSVSGELHMLYALIQDVHGLSPLNMHLLKQRGTDGEPDDPYESSTQEDIHPEAIVAQDWTEIVLFQQFC